MSLFSLLADSHVSSQLNNIQSNLFWNNRCPACSVTPNQNHFHYLCKFVLLAISLHLSITVTKLVKAKPPPAHLMLNTHAHSRGGDFLPAKSVIISRRDSVSAYCPASVTKGDLRARSADLLWPLQFSITCNHQKGKIDIIYFKAHMGSQSWTLVFLSVFVISFSVLNQCCGCWSMEVYLIWNR